MPVLDWVVARGEPAPDRFVQALDATAGQATSLLAALALGGEPRRADGRSPTAVAEAFAGAFPSAFPARSLAKPNAMAPCSKRF